MTLYVIVALWLLVTGIGSVLTARTWLEARKDLQWAQLSGRNGRFTATAKALVAQKTMYFSMQLVGFFTGSAILFESRQARGWTFLAMVSYWSIALSWAAWTNLQERREQLKETSDRMRGAVRTRETDIAKTSDRLP